MEEDLYKNVLPHIFKYLNGYDLYIASRVNSVWKKLAISEESSRGPACIARYKEECIDPDNLNTIQREITACCPTRPALSIFFNPNIFEKITSEGCHCKCLPFNAYSVTLNQTPIRSFSPILGCFFPEAPLININTFTIYNIPSLPELYCHEQRCFFNDNFLNADRLCEVMKPIFTENSPLTSCFILFSRRNTDHRVFCLEMALRDWFPETNITIWGGQVNNITVCDRVRELPTCIEYPEMVIIIISGMVQTYSVYVNNTYITMPEIEKKLKLLQEKLTLKKHSMGFMFAANIFPALFDMEVKIFTKFFPNMPLAAYYGFQAYGGVNDSDRAQIVQSYNACNNTCFMIITYD
ncbi:hypothetical protein M0804_002621 [Polistes exclamans]|nr:hypothetical protein M0804_002621 [Polistes exclamans]